MKVVLGTPTETHPLKRGTAFQKTPTWKRSATRRREAMETTWLAGGRFGFTGGVSLAGRGYEKLKDRELP